MVEASAAPQSVAPRLNYAEQAIAWLMDNRGGGDGDPETTAQLQRLFKIIMAGAVASGAGNWDEPWEDVLLYEDGVSMHVTLFGLNGQNAIACQDGKGFYGRVFSNDEARWAGTGASYDKTLADDVLGRSDSGYVEALRAADRSLAQAVFKNAANAGGLTIIDRIAAVQADLDELADNNESAVNGLNNQITALNASIADLQQQINDLKTGGGARCPLCSATASSSSSRPQQPPSITSPECSPLSRSLLSPSPSTNTISECG